MATIGCRAHFWFTDDDEFRKNQVCEIHLDIECRHCGNTDTFEFSRYEGWTTPICSKCGKSPLLEDAEADVPT